MSAASRVFNLIATEGDETPLPAAGPLDFAPVAVRTPPLPAYVNHQEGVSEVGALSAHAIAIEYEAAAREIEAMGAELKAAAKRCEDMTAGVHKMVGDIAALASRYRSEGKRYFEEIENCTKLTDNVRELCATLSDKIATANTE